MDYKVSVIIPVYNVEKYLEISLTSVMNQTLHDIEIICVDDCSTDRSRSICEEFSKKDSRIKVIALDKNSGAAVARNKGLESAAGDYYGFVDPDDEIDLNYYESLYRKAEETGAEVVKCERRTFESDGRIWVSHLNYEIRENDDLYFTHEWQCGLYKASLIKDNGIRFVDELIKAQDIVFLTEVLLKKTTPLAFVDGVYYNYHKRLDSLNGLKIPLESIKSAVKARKYQTVSINKSGLYNKKHDIYFYLYLKYLDSIAGYTAFQNDSFEAKLECAKGLIYIYNLCIDREYLKKRLTYNEKILNCIVNNNPEKLAEFLLIAKRKSDLHKKFLFLAKAFRKLKRVLKVLKREMGGGMKLLISGGSCGARQNKFHDLINKNMTVNYVHIMKNNKFIKPFVDFLNRNFDTNEHMFIITKNKEFAAPIPQGNNVYEFFDINKIDFRKNNVKKIIWHALFVPGSVELLYKNRDLLRKSYWLIWGADLYNAPRDEKNDFVRKNFNAYISDTDGDCEVAKQKYNSNPKTYNAAYTFPITSEMISSCRKDAHDFVKIQINNSCDFSTLEMLDILSKFKNENIKITTILAYGQMQFKEEIIKKGKEIFDDNFSYLDKLLSPKEYAQLLSQNDILILNQSRQQGLGNSFATLALGQKLFIKSDVTTFSHFNSRGIKVYDTYEIENMNFDDFIFYDSVTKQNNIEKVAVFFHDDYLKSLWAKIFEEA